jgi:hypothetical protein
VIAAVEEYASTGWDAARRGSGKGKAVAGNADAAKNIQAKLLGQFWLEESIEVGQKGAKGFAIVRIVAALKSPGGLCVEAEVVPEFDEVAADAEIGSTLLGGRLEVHRVIIDGRSHENTPAEHDVRLLGSGEVSEQKNRTREYEQREFSQYIPLSVRAGFWNAPTRLVARRCSSRERLLEYKIIRRSEVVRPDDIKTGGRVIESQT